MPRSPLDDIIATVEADIARLQDVLEKLRAAKAATESILPDRLQKSIVNGNDMDTEHRIAISKGHPDDRDAEFRETIRKAKPKGYTQNTLAKGCRISPTLMSMYRQGKRPAPLAIRSKVNSLTGWPLKAWPKIAKED